MLLGQIDLFVETLAQVVERVGRVDEQIGDVTHNKA